MSLVEFRAAVEQFRGVGFEGEEVAGVDDLYIPDESGKQILVRLYRPEAKEATLPVLVWAHGGSWVRVSIDLLDGHYRAMANRSGCVIAVVDYTLSPEARFPTAIEEVYAAARWIKREGTALGLDPTRIGIGGESSGGNLAAAATLVDRERRLVGFGAQILVVPVLDVRFSSESWRELGEDYLLTKAQLEWALEQYAPGVDPADPLLSPLYAKSFAGLPPAFVVTGELDPLKDEGNAYAKALAKAGVPVRYVEVPGMIHHAVMAPKVMRIGREMIVDAADAAGEALHAKG